MSSKAAVARSLAALLGLADGGELDPAAPPPGRVYLVPSDTLQHDDAARLGVHGADDLFGGVVPFPFVATKVISHPLVDEAAVAPQGWCHALGERLRDHVLPGYSVFSAEDALRAGERLLSDGTVRVKEAGGVGGLGQTVAPDRATLRAAIDRMDAEVLRRDGLVIERNLNNVTTFSVGQVRVGPYQASYCGTQCLTRNHRGHAVYGGSDLTVARGDYDELLQLDLPANVRRAVEQALAYQRLAFEAYPGLYASRCNYDIAQGSDDTGLWRSGVLEQSWRIGGASAAEVAALHALRADPQRRLVRASTHELYADDVAVPEGATVTYDGDDAQVGRLVKYARVEPQPTATHDNP